MRPPTPVNENPGNVAVLYIYTGILTKYIHMLKMVKLYGSVIMRK